MIVAGIAWNVIMWWLVIAQPAPHLDKHHCWTDHAAFVTYCFPKDGCFLDAADNAMCWRAKATLHR